VFLPGFSPDGRLFAMGWQPRGQLLRYDADARRFEPFLRGISAYQVDVSPDGQRAVYVNHPEGELWLSRIDGLEKRRLTLEGVANSMPRWSPDGRSIAYVARLPGEHRMSVRRIFSDGSGDELLEGTEPDRGAWSACWLPHWDSLVFSHLDLAHPGVFIIDVRARRVSAVPGAESSCSRSVRSMATSWRGCRDIYLSIFGSAGAAAPTGSPSSCRSSPFRTSRGRRGYHRLQRPRAPGGTFLVEDSKLDHHR
jgi:Tol biopolymer transport system component